MILTAENYYSQEADMEYMSVSQYKAFVIMSVTETRNGTKSVTA